MSISQFNKLAFITNIAFLLAMVMRYYPFLPGTPFQSALLIGGLVLSPLFNVFVLLANLYWQRKGMKQFHKTIPLLNAGFLLLQVFLLLTGILSLGNTNS
jgi:hypothetical protein